MVRDKAPQASIQGQPALTIENAIAAVAVSNDIGLHHLKDILDRFAYMARRSLHVDDRLG